MAKQWRSGIRMREPTVAALCDRLIRRAELGNATSALQGIVGFVMATLAQQSSFARVFSSKELDAASLAIGRTLREFEPAIDATDRVDCIVFIATHLAPTGGHSRLLVDLIEAERAGEFKILVTNLYNRFDADEVMRLYQGRNVSLEVAPKLDLAARTRWMQQRLAEIGPRKTYMLNHHFDAVSVAAVQPDLVGDLVYIHHCDYSLALGVHIPHALHVDLSAKGFRRCREREGVPGNIKFPLIVPDHGDRTERPFLVRGHLTTCCCGGAEKFEFGSGRGSARYAYRYEELVPYILRASGGTHIHIGRLSPWMIDSIERGLKYLGVSRDRFVHVEFVEDLWLSLLEFNVDAYIGSFPMGGGRAAVEAMGAGIPLVVHLNYRSNFFSSVADVYPQAMVWETPEGLFAALKSLTVVELREHARLARAFYVRNHSAELLPEAIACSEHGSNAEPERPNYVGNALQAFVDENEAVFANWFLRKRGRTKKSLFGRLVQHFRSLTSRGKLSDAPALRQDWLDAIKRLESRIAQGH